MGYEPIYQQSLCACSQPRGQTPHIPMLRGPARGGGDDGAARGLPVPRVRMQHAQAGLLSGREATKAQSTWDPSGGRAQAYTALRDPAAETGSMRDPGHPSQGRWALGGQQRREGHGPARPPCSDKPPQKTEPIRRRFRCSLCFSAEQELRWSSDFYGTSKGNN